MRLQSVWLAASLLATPAISTPTNTPSGGKEVLALQAVAWRNLAEYTHKNGIPNKRCKLEKAAVRREWSALSKPDRRKFIDAVLCLSKKPPLTPASLNTGVRSRYDDFVLTHINQTFFIHGTGNFFMWHRYFTWSFEQALRNECGYDGYVPYMDWGKYAEDPVNSPIFDGSGFSLSGDGAFVRHDPIPFPSAEQPVVMFPPNNGGGCVTEGPFVDFKVNMGPCFPILNYIEPNPFANCTGYNPRCLRRDISKFISSGWTKDVDTADVIKDFSDPTAFLYRFQGDFLNGYVGVHTGGHFTWGGDPGGDFANSPADPAFWLHHANVDRVVWIWQNQDPEARTYAVGGTLTINNDPPSRNTTLEDIIDLGLNGGPLTIRDVSNTLGGPFCYVY